MHAVPVVKYRLDGISGTTIHVSNSNHNDHDLKNSRVDDYKKKERSFGDIAINTDDDNNNGLTVVTAYFNIRSFQKGDRSTIFTSSLYRKRMTVFACIENPLVVFSRQ